MKTTNKTTMAVVFLLALFQGACRTGLEYDECENMGGGQSSGGASSSTTSSPSITSGAGGDGGAPACSLDECDPEAVPFAQKQACDDEGPLTVDRCQTTACGAACIHVPAQCDSLDPIDVQKAICDDGNPCTNDRCYAQDNFCTHDALVNGTPCGAGFCRFGACKDDCYTVACKGRDCGIGAADCDENGDVESFACGGGCALPEVCAGSGTSGKCGAECLAQFGDECAAAGLPSGWGFAQGSACEASAYKIVDGSPVYCLNCAPSSACAPFVVGAKAIWCCP